MLIRVLISGQQTTYEAKSILDIWEYFFDNRNYSRSEDEFLGALQEKFSYTPYTLQPRTARVTIAKNPSKNHVNVSDVLKERRLEKAKEARIQAEKEAQRVERDELYSKFEQLSYDKVISAQIGSFAKIGDIQVFNPDGEILIRDLSKDELVEIARYLRAAQKVLLVKEINETTQDVTEYDEEGYPFTKEFTDYVGRVSVLEF